jgi:hypothetical protein
MHIAFYFLHGFAARMILRAGVAERLVGAGAHVSVISPNAHEAYFQEECRQTGVVLTQEPTVAGRTAYWFRRYRAYLMGNVMSNPGLRAGHLDSFQSRPFRRFILEVLNGTAARSLTFRRASRALERRLNRSENIRNLLAGLRPDLLVVFTPFGQLDTIYLIHAKDLKIPVVCQMLSWDNITSKGTPLLMPDYFISWGPIMTQEMVQWYRFPREKIFECGVPHFDVYRHPEQLTSSGALLRELNLNPACPYIFYGTVASMHCPNELEILAWLAEQVARNAFSKPCSLVIRPHPQMISGYAGSAMCINASSTLCLDACMLDRPVVNIGFDGRQDLPYEKSARRGLDYIHMRKLLSLGGVRLARSFAELQRHVNAYLDDPCLDHEGRRLTAAQECGLADGRAAERVADTLLELAQRTSAKKLRQTASPDIGLEAHSFQSRQLY